MQVVIFYGNVSNGTERKALTQRLNEFLRGIPKNGITKIQNIPCQDGHAAVFIWLRADAK